MLNEMVNIVSHIFLVVNTFTTRIVCLVLIPLSEKNLCTFYPCYSHHGDERC